MEGPEILIPILVVGMLFIGLLWIILHYVSKWKTAATLTTEDERLLEDLHELARRLDDRMLTVERIVQADNPNWRQLGGDPVETMLEDRGERLLADRNDRIERTERSIRRNV
ncbi:envelope stress response membrane protein PspB [Sphingosinicella sp.]|uniref:envelope stress response membrane protein PspB n=1 Tax=Sphingosinicella sp. TaxID=1917971 RepID=UPI004037EFDD